MHENLMISALLLAAGWLLLDGLRAGERAVAICSRVCEERHLQLLDQTVSLHRIGIRWGAGGIRLRRVYCFDYSEDGERRHTGYLGPVNTNPIGSVAPEKVPIKARGAQFGYSK